MLRRFGFCFLTLDVCESTIVGSKNWATTLNFTYTGTYHVPCSSSVECNLMERIRLVFNGAGRWSDRSGTLQLTYLFATGD
jgi:hypothetical protein